LQSGHIIIPQAMMGICNILDCCNRINDNGDNLDTARDYKSADLKMTAIPTKRNNSSETQDTILSVEEPSSPVKEQYVPPTPYTAVSEPGPSPITNGTFNEARDNHAKNLNTVIATPKAVTEAINFNETVATTNVARNHHALPPLAPVQATTAPSAPQLPISKNQAQLARECPEATSAELVRFLAAKDGDYKKAHKQLRTYLDWRNFYGMDRPIEPIENAPSSRSTEDYQSCCSNIISDDENDWNIAARDAMSAEPDKERYKGAPFPKLPRLARFDDVDGNERISGVDGNRILQLLPAQLDTKLATEETYALTIAFYLDRQLDRNATERITVFVDVRGGHGWPNPPARSVVPFIKGIIAVLEANFPERLSASIVCPMPFAAIALWKVIKVFLDPTTAKKIAVIRGSAERDSTLPHEKLKTYIDRETLAIMEKNRLSTFTNTKTKR